MTMVGRMLAEIAGVLDKSCCVANGREIARHISDAGVFLLLKEWSIAGDEPVERAQALEILARVVDGFVHARRLILEHCHRTRDLLGADGAKVLGEGTARTEGVGHGCATSSPSVASAWLE